MTALLATYLLYAVALGAALAWLWSPRPGKLSFALAAVLAVAVDSVLVKLLGALWTDPRPFVVDHTTPSIAHNADNGFPSDHTALATAIALVVLTRNRLVGALLLVLAVVLGVARVAAHVHHVPDILGGLGAGVVAAASGVALARLIASPIDRRWPALSGAVPQS